MLKPAYGEDDACHRWWVTLSGFLQEIGGVVSKLDHCVISFYDENRKLAVMDCSWVDDLYISGKDSYTSPITEKITEGFTTGKVLSDRFKYTSFS